MLERHIVMPRQMQGAQTLPSTWQVSPIPGAGRFEVGLLLLTVVELLLAGSGRPIEMGPVTARMVLFGAALLYGYVSLARKELHLSADLVLGVICAAGALAVGTIVGFLNSNGRDFIFLDLRYYAYFLSLPFFLVTVRSTKVIRLLRRLIKWCAVTLAIAYGAVQLLIMSGMLSADALRAFADNTADFTPRAAPEVSSVLPFDFQVFFYSAFVFLGIGVIFYVRDKSLLSKCISVFILFMLFCTLTRGFVVGLGGVVLVYVALNRRAALRNALLVLSMLALVTASLAISTDAGRELSDTLRMRTITAVFDRLTPETLLWGHGFGASVPADARNAAELKKSRYFQDEIRYLHLENSYVEILDKQGLVGLSFYAAVLIVIIRQFVRLRNSPHRVLAEQFFLGTIYIYLVSLFNPYITNSIGMGFVCVSIAALAALQADVRRMPSGGEFRIQCA